MWWCNALVERMRPWGRVARPVEAGRKGGVMRAWTKISIVVLAAVATAPTADAATTTSCSQLVQQINALQTTVATNAAQYWAHRANFIGLQEGQSRSIVPDAVAKAQKEKSAAAPLKAGMPSALQTLKSLVETAKSQSCLPIGQLQQINESVFKLAKSVNFDQFPTNTIENPYQSTLPTWLPPRK
jgi:hypothetical protein